MAISDAELRIEQRDHVALDDRMLVLDFQAGDPEAFVEIHRRYGGLARHVCRRFLPNPQDADEAFQETMIRVFQGLYRFNGRYALQPWIARIATNVSLDQLRTAARRPAVENGTIEDGEWPDVADGPEVAYERLVQRDLVLSVLEGMPENHRAALVLRELDGRSHQEIAKALDITPAQAKALIHRAKGSFRRGWLRAMSERGGFAGVAILPLLWLLKAGDLARRFVDRAGHATQVAQVATPEVVT
ncbi:MAG TPA: sigma-70 family RNA polymerase sigma factor, partial [Actinomycetota bacterium]|nr:sigma-70 family RNA polymerase sigma factor [Actinomycetota bacterium]